MHSTNIFHVQKCLQLFTLQPDCPHGLRNAEHFVRIMHWCDFKIIGEFVNNTHQILDDTFPGKQMSSIASNGHYTRHVQKQTEDVAFQRVTVDSAHLQHCVTLHYINVLNNNNNNNLYQR